MPSAAQITPRYAPPFQSRGECVQIVGAKVERRNPEERPANRFAEIHPNATVRRARKRDIAVSEGAAQADRLDPDERAFDLPGDDVVQPGIEADTAKADSYLAVRPIADLQVCETRPDAPKSEDGHRAAADPHRESLERHAVRIVAGQSSARIHSCRTISTEISTAGVVPLFSSQ